MLKEDVLDYIMNTPHNTNWAVLKTIVSDNEELYKYITETPYNMNRAVVSGILDRIDEGGEDEDEDILEYPYLLLDTFKNVTLNEAYTISQRTLRCNLSGMSLTEDEMTAIKGDVTVVSIKFELNGVETPIEITFEAKSKMQQQQMYVVGDGGRQQLTLPQSGSGNGSVIVDLTPELENITSKADIDRIQVIILKDAAMVGTAVVGTSTLGV